jgi:hypothetical protein
MSSSTFSHSFDEIGTLLGILYLIDPGQQHTMQNKENQQTGDRALLLKLHQSGGYGGYDI